MSAAVLAQAARSSRSDLDAAPVQWKGLYYFIAAAETELENEGKVKTFFIDERFSGLIAPFLQYAFSKGMEISSQN